MDNIPTVNSEVDTDGKDVSQYCLGLPTILRQILEQFSSTELLELSLVNKLWNFEARSVMKERGNLSAISYKGGRDKVNACEKLVALASDLERMRLIPFAGITFVMSHHMDYCSVSDGALLQPAYEVLLDLIPWKHFSVSFHEPWFFGETCPALVLVKRILKDYCNVLEDLTIGSANEEFLGNIFQDRTFPRLKSLTVKSGEFGHLTNTYVTLLLSSAPNLQELNVGKEIDLTVNIFEGRSSSVVFVPKFRFQPLFTPICEDLIDAIRSEDMELGIHCGEFDLELLDSFIPRVLEASRTSLKTLSMEFLSAVPLMCYGICLENVTKLELHMNCHLLDDIETPILQLPAGLDFTRVFPKLTQVLVGDNDYIPASADVISAFVEKGQEMLNSALPDRAINIKTLNIDRCEHVQDNTLSLLGMMFPDVRTVYRSRQDQELSLTALRGHFSDLEEVIESYFGITLSS